MPHATTIPLETKSIDELFDRLENAVADNPGEHVRMRIAKLQRLADSAHAENVRDSSQNHIDLAWRAVEIMSSHTDAPLTIVQIAEMCGVSPTLLKQTFRSVMGIPVYQWYRAHRIDRACALLQDTELPIAQVATAVGYSNPSKFAKAFKDETGISPREWRTNNPSSIGH